MFEALSDRFEGVLGRLKGKGKLTEADVDDALREIRLALLEADVNFTVVKNFVARVRERCLGEELSKASCVTCHGNELAGTDLAPALHGDDFKGVWTGRTAAELFEKIHTTMPADNVGTLKAPQSADLVAYILKLNGYPSGAAELASEMPALQQIKIASKQ